MNKNLLILALLAGSPFFAFAQKVKYGLKVGGSFTQISGDAWKDESRVNPLAGVFVRSEALRFSLAGELLFSQGTYTTTAGVRGFPATFYANAQDSLKQGRFGVNYLSIPVLAGIKITKPLWLQAGAQFSGIVAVDDKEALLKDAKDLFKVGSIAIVGGIWINWSKHINAGLRAVIGVSNVNDVPAVSETWKQRALQLHIGYTF